ncbi:OTU domain-containing protein [Pyxidicoccus sp. 3LFB2]
MEQHTGRAASGQKLKVLTALARRFIEPEKYNPKKATATEIGAIAEQEEDLLNDLARFFAARVRRALWPGATPESSPDPGWSETVQALGEDRLAALSTDVETAWTACEPALVARFGRPVEEEDPPQRLVATGIDVYGKKEPKLAAYCKLCVQLLVEEGYYDWLQPYDSNYSTKEKDAKQGPAALERKKRDELAKLGVEQLRLHTGIQFHRFLAVVAGMDVKKVPLTQQIPLENSLYRSNDEHLQRVYQAKLADYLERKSDMEDAPDSHGGLNEFLRIRDALNAQCKDRGEEPYLSYPDKVPTESVKGLYTQDEAYGVLWRKSRVEIRPEDISYVSAYLAKSARQQDGEVSMEVEEEQAPASGGGDDDAVMENEDLEEAEKDAEEQEEDAEEGEAGSAKVKSRFSKREPIRIPVRLAQVKDGPVVGVIAWHPPAPGARNESARGRDFPAFLEYCKTERERKSLGVILSDLNIDTANPKKDLAPDETPYIDTCKPKLSFHQFFGSVLGPGADASPLYNQAPQLSTIAKSKFGEWAVNDKHDFGDGSLQLLRTLLGKQVNAKTFAPTTTKKGRELPPPLTSTNEVLGYIESFATPPQQRYGASGYDKILVYSPRTDGWTLEQASVFVIPFPMVLADAKEQGLFFIHGKLLPRHLQPFWRLVQEEDAKLSEEQRIFARLRPDGVKLTGSDDSRWEAVMAASKKLSDHMPLVSDLRLVYTGAEALVLEEVPLAPGVSSALEELESLCAAYQAFSGSDEEAAAALSQILEVASGVPEAEHGRSGALVAGAMQVRETLVALRAEGFDTTEYWGKRPALKSEGSRKGAAAGSSLDAHLLTLHHGRVNNAGGGDCLFRSLSQLLYGTEAHHGAVRQAVVNHLDDLLAGRTADAGGLVGPTPAETFRQDMTLLLDWHREAWPHEPAYRRVAGVEAWSQYLRAMSRGGVWGDHVALAAASHLFGVRFQLFARTSHTSFWTDDVDFVARAEGHEGARVLRLANLGNAHYEAVGPSAGPLPAVAAFPVELAALSERRRRDGEGGGPGPGTPTKPSSTASNGVTSSSAPVPTGPVFLWPHTVFFKPNTPALHPQALFLFGENDVAKKNKYFQNGTQAIIRMNPNALGIRTCWFAGIGMKDVDLAKNMQAIDDDVDEAIGLLKTGAYTTLVVPWNHTLKSVDIGTGWGNLPTGAPKTWAHLVKKVDELMDWAKKNLSTVMVVTQASALVPSVLKHQPSELHVQEVSDAMLRAASVGGDSSTSLLGASNVVSLRTLLFSGASSHETGLLKDDDLEKNKAMLDADLEELSRQVESGRYRALVLPRDTGGRIALGTGLGKLDTFAPKTFSYLQERLAALCKRCEEVRIASTMTSQPQPQAEQGHAMEDVEPSPGQPASKAPSSGSQNLKRKFEEEPSEAENEEEAEPVVVPVVVEEAEEDAPKKLKRLKTE